MGRNNITDVYLDWKEFKRQCVKVSTYATYVTHAEKHILPAFGMGCSVSEAEARRFVASLVDDGLSYSTVRDILHLLRMILAHGRRTGMIDWEDWDIRLPKANAHGGPAVLSVAQQRKLMVFLAGNFSFRNLGVYICLCTGMRIGEICALRWGDINLRSRVIKVARTIERVYVPGDPGKRTVVVIGPPKTASAMRDVPVNGILYSVLKPLESFSRPGNYVLSNGGKPIEPRTYRRYFGLLMRRLGMPGIKFHGLRHTFATRCIESSCDYKTVSSILGHANINTTLNLYMHPGIEQKRKCVDRMMKTVMK